MNSIYLVIFCMALYMSVQNEAILMTQSWIREISSNQRMIGIKTEEELRNSKKPAFLDFVGLARKYGYPAEEHNITTEDGYKLIIHRIPPTRNSGEQKRKVVYIQHGLICASHVWMLRGPRKDLPLLLADKGYDVWVGNFRGNTYCLSHTNLTTHDKEFWQYSFHEHGIYDLPAAIDYVLKVTGQSKLYYIGHSMGTTASFVLLSMRPEYNEKFHAVVSLAPVVYLHNNPSMFLKMLIMKVGLWKGMLELLGVYKILHQTQFTKTLCSRFLIRPICDKFIKIGSTRNFLLSLDCFSQPDIYSYFPCGTSTQTLYHYHQIYEKGRFEAYDYENSLENMNRYGKWTPPEYPLRAITAPQLLFYADNDSFIHEENVVELSKQLKNATLYKIRQVGFSHTDFMWSANARSVVYDDVIRAMKQY